MVRVPSDDPLQSSDPTGERRGSKRVSYDTTVGWAAETGKRIPPATSFQQARGSDLSLTGISFLADVWPTSERIVLKLGATESPRYAATRIVSCRALGAGYGSREFEVRCEFERWLEA